MIESASFREDLNQAADHSLAVLVDLAQAATYENMERNYPLARDEFPEKLKAFDRVLHDLLGSAKNLHNNLGLKINEEGDWKLVDYVNHAKKAQMSVRKNGET